MTTRPTAPPPRSSCCSAPAPAARPSAAAYAAVATDAAALYYNPAGAALGTRPERRGRHLRLRRRHPVQLGWHRLPVLGGSKVFGIQLGTFGFKDQPVYTVEQPDGTGATYSVNETFVGLTYAQQFSDRFSAGITPRVCSTTWARSPAGHSRLDFGADFHSHLDGKPVRLGFTVQNLGTTLSYSGGDLNRTIPRDTAGAGTEPAPVELKTKAFSLPTVFQVALAYDVVSLSNQNNKLHHDRFVQPGEQQPRGLRGRR